MMYSTGFPSNFLSYIMFQSTLFTYTSKYLFLITAHPKVRVFITQGGLQSFQETVHYGVPTVGIPWFGDQECNVAKMVDAKIGVLLPPKELTSYEKIKSAIEAVLYDER